MLTITTISFSIYYVHDYYYVVFGFPYHDDEFCSYHYLCYCYFGCQYVAVAGLLPAGFSLALPLLPAAAASFRPDSPGSVVKSEFRVWG